jgi:hypothetical protein
MTDYDYQITEQDIDWNAVAIALAQQQDIPGFTSSHVTDYGDRRLHVFENTGYAVKFEIEVKGDTFAATRTDQILNGTKPKVCQRLASGSFEELSMFSAERFLRSALRHGVDSDPDHEVGDLQDYLREMWSILTPEQKLAFARKEAVLATLEAAEVGEREDLLKETFAS